MSDVYFKWLLRCLDLLVILMSLFLAPAFPVFFNNVRLSKLSTENELMTLLDLVVI
jgi:hypothetical protein